VSDLARLIERPDWMADANCRDVEDRSIFYPGQGESTKPAKDICRRCDVQVECLFFAMQNREIFGIWGGKSERERRALRKRYPMLDIDGNVRSERGPMPGQPFEHGDINGYRTHLRRGEEPCADCRRAHAVDVADKRAKRRDVA
jgi:WhiB family transcriptional regulator, redox-sensing transcriptional regulator